MASNNFVNSEANTLESYGNLEDMFHEYLHNRKYIIHLRKYTYIIYDVKKIFII